MFRDFFYGKINKVIGKWVGNFRRYHSLNYRKTIRF